MNIVSLFSGCGGLDYGFSLSAFNVIWANEYDKTIWETYELNHPNTYLDKRDIRVIPSSEIPDCDGIIGGPPCISWSVAGKRRGINDSNGQLFYEYVRILREKQPKFFLAENVRGILSLKNKEAFDNILLEFEKIGYSISFKLLNANDYGVPQDRWRVFIVGIRKDIHKTFTFPNPTYTTYTKTTLNNSIWTLKDITPRLVKGKILEDSSPIKNHNYSNPKFSGKFLKGNRVRSWDEPSFTIMSHEYSIPYHPQANKMVKNEEGFYEFDSYSLLPYRLLTVRECARIQTFPDDFVFKYDYVVNGYKMVGNAVSVNLARVLAEEIFTQLNR